MQTMERGKAEIALIGAFCFSPFPALCLNAAKRSGGWGGRGIAGLRHSLRVGAKQAWLIEYVAVHRIIRV